MEHKKSNLDIYFTTDYGRFSFLKGNRDLNEQKILAIKQDIKDGFDILRYAPIIVNEKMEILDGQHRFMVSKLTKQNVYYVINSEIDLLGVTKINSKSSNWKNKDFLESFCDLKREDYIYLRDQVKAHKGLTLPVAIQILHNGFLLNVFTNKQAINAFREGDFKAKHREYFETTVAKLEGFRGHMQSPLGSRMWHTIKRLEKGGKYDHEQMIAKLKKTEGWIEGVSVKEIINSMEMILNHKAKNRILII